jgi:hypothetical protein
MFNRRSMLTVCGAAIVAVVLVGSVEALENGRRTNYLTFNTPFALPGVALPPGTYIFELADHDVSLDIVRVLNRDRSQVYLTAFTRAIERPRGMRPDRAVSFGEVPKGMTPPVTAWYPTGEAVGHQFVYAKNSRQLAARAGN